MVFVPEKTPDGPLLLHYPFRWDANAPAVAIACSVGLAEVEARGALRRLEIVFAFNSPGFSSEFLEHLSSLVSTMKENLSAGTPIQFGDLFSHFPVFDNRSPALLIPPVPEAFVSGLHPRACTSVDDWAEPRAGKDDVSFVQVVPLFPGELEMAKAMGGLGFFAHKLLASDEELAEGRDAAFRILDMKRADLSKDGLVKQKS